MDKVIKIALYQGYHGRGVPGEVIAPIIEEKPDILCLSEYFFVGPDEQSILLSAARHDTHLQYLLDLSIKLDCAIVGGTLLIKEGEEYRNRAYFITGGKNTGHYDKIHPYRNEGNGQVRPGRDYKVFKFKGIRVGILICADVLYQDSFYKMKGLKPDLIIVPVTSPFRAGETAAEKYSRDEELWVTGARIADCPIVKAGSVGMIAGRPLQGRSLAADQNGIIFRVPPEEESNPMLKFLDITL